MSRGDARLKSQKMIKSLVNIYPYEWLAYVFLNDSDALIYSHTGHIHNVHLHVSLVCG